MPSYFRIHIDGTLAAGAERWSSSFAVEDTGGSVPPTPANVAAAAQAVFDLFVPSTGWPAALKTLLSSAGGITKVRVYWHPNVGQPALVAGESTGTAIIGNSTAQMPTQCTLVFSLRSGLSGRSYRGRMYWPIQNSGFTSGRATAVSASTATAAKDMLNAVRAISYFGSTSRVVVVSEAASALTPVSRVVIDDLVDTQRRRRDALVGTVYSATL